VAFTCRNSERSFLLGINLDASVGGETARLVATSGFKDGERLPSDMETVVASKRMGP
jgi:hypothetical protein